MYPWTLGLQRKKTTDTSDPLPQGAAWNAATFQGRYFAFSQGITATDDSDTLLVIDTDIDKLAVGRDSDLEMPKLKTTKKQKPNRHKNKRHSNH
jgi:hypothetical protein